MSNRIKEKHSLKLKRFIIVRHKSNYWEYFFNDSIYNCFEKYLAHQNLLTGLSKAYYAKAIAMDNAPRKLNRIEINLLVEKWEVLHDYVYWFNHIRRSNKLKYTTPIKYRNRALSLA